MRITNTKCVSVAIDDNIIWGMRYAWALLCYHLWLLWLHHICQHYLINGTIFQIKVNEQEMCLIFL